MLQWLVQVQSAAEAAIGPASVLQVKRISLCYYFFSKQLSKVFLLALSNLQYIIIAYTYHVIHFLLLCGGGDLAHMANLSPVSPFLQALELW